MSYLSKTIRKAPQRIVVDFSSKGSKSDSRTLIPQALPRAAEQQSHYPGHRKERYVSYLLFCYVFCFCKDYILN